MNLRALKSNPIGKLHPFHGDPRHALTRLTERHGLCANAVFIFYLISAYIAYSNLRGIHYNERLTPPAYQWPVAWLDWVNIESGPQWIGIGVFVMAIVCALNTSARMPRILFAILAWMGAALHASYGAVSHGLHIWIWIAVFLAFAPADLSGKASRRNKLLLLAAVSGAQIYILLTYTMAGINKVKGGLAAIADGDAGNFSWTGFANQIADRILQTETAPFAAEFIINHPALVAPMFWFVIFAQFFALFVILMPRLHRSFGFVMIAFHFGTWALMEITFPAHVMWLLIFFVFSPFRPQHVSDSPVEILKDCLKWLSRRTWLQPAPARRTA